MTYEEVFDNCFLFQDLKEAERALLKPLFSLCSCEEGEMVFEQGDPAIHLYIVVEGEVKIRFKPEDGAELTVATIRPGGVFGWSSTFGSDYYTSGAICTRNTHLLRVRGEDLKTLCENHPETGILIIERLAGVVAERLRSTHKQVVALLSHSLRNGYNYNGG